MESLEFVGFLVTLPRLRVFVDFRACTALKSALFVALHVTHHAERPDLSLTDLALDLVDCMTQDVPSDVAFLLEFLPAVTTHTYASLGALSCLMKLLLGTAGRGLGGFLGRLGGS